MTERPTEPTPTTIEIEPTPSRVFTIGQASEILRFSVYTLENWDKSGVLKASGSTRHGKRKYGTYTEENLLDFLSQSRISEIPLESLPEKLITRSEVCTMLRLKSNITLLNWEKNGTVEAFRIGPRKNRRYDEKEILALINKTIDQSTSKESLDLYTIREVSELCRLTVNTLHAFDKSGVLPAIHLGTRGDRLYSKQSLLDFLNQSQVDPLHPDELPEDLITIAEAAKLFYVSISTLRLWTRRGKIPTYYIGPRRDRRFRLSIIEELMPEPVKNKV